MRKSITSIVVILVIAALVAPFGMGFYVQDHIEPWAKALFSMNPEVKVSVDNLDRGWFSTSADVTIDLTPVYEKEMGTTMQRNPMMMGLMASFMKLKFKEVVYHGPFIIAKNGQGNWGFHLGRAFATLNWDMPQMFQTGLKTLLGKDDLSNMLSVDILASYGGKLYMTLNQAPIKFSKAGGVLDWKGITANWTFDADSKDYNGKMVLNGLDATAPNNAVAIKLSPVTVGFDGRYESDADSIGNATFDLPHFSVMLRGVERFLLSGWKMQVKSTVKNYMADQNLKMEIKTVQNKSDAYGPGQMQLNISNVNVKHLANMNKDNSNYLQNQNARTQNRSVTMAYRLRLFSHLAAAFSEATVQLKQFQLQLPEGTLKADASVVFNNPKDNNLLQVNQQANGAQAVVNTDLQMEIKQRQQVLARFAAATVLDANVTLPKQLVEKIVTNTVARRLRQQQIQLLFQEMKKSQQRIENGNNDASAATPDTAPAKPFVPMTKEALQKAAKEAADEEIKTWIDKGYLNLEGDSYKIAIQMRDTKITFNGKAVDL